MTDANWQGYIRELLYPVMFERDPLAAIERVISGLRADVPRSQYADAIRQALASDAVLSRLLPKAPAETAVRAYLSKLAERLERTTP